MDLKFNTICRVCLMNTQELKNIFNENLSQYIMTFALVKVNHNDGLPQCICKTCVEELRTAVRFKEKCEKSHLKLYEYINSLANVDTQVAMNDINLDFYHTSFKNDPKTSTEMYDDVSSILGPSDVLVNDYKIETQEYFSQSKADETVFECISCKKQDQSLHTFHMCESCSQQTDIPKNNVKVNENDDFSNDAESNEIELDSTKDDPTKSETKPRIKKIHQCEYCGKITNCKSGLLKHMSLHTNERPFKCNTCGKSFRLRSFLTKHLLTHAGVRSHHCMFCPKSFVLKSSLASHMKTHSGEKKFTCNVCNKKFKSSRSLHYHLKLHTGERNYPCSQCDKAFVNRFDLRRHLKLHDKYQAIKEGTYDRSQEPPKQMHQCENCGKFFPSRSDLTKHFRVHTGVKPFKCQYCGKAFIGSSALTVHIRTHTGAKPYRCQHCNQSFAQSSNLKVHVRLHTGVRPYVCTLCNKGYNRKRDLDTHLKKHALTDKI